MLITDDLKNQIIQIHQQESRPFDGKFFLFEYIPPQKLINATNSYALSLRDDEAVIFLYDDTVAGSANDGFLLTNRRIYFKNFLETGSFVDIAAIDNITVKHGLLTSALYVNRIDSGAVSITLTDTNKKQKDGLLNVLNRTVELLIGETAAGNQTANAGEAAARPTNCRNCGAHYPPNSNNCEYCGSAVI